MSNKCEKCGEHCLECECQKYLFEFNLLKEQFTFDENEYSPHCKNEYIASVCL